MPDIAMNAAGVTFQSVLYTPGDKCIPEGDMQCDPDTLSKFKCIGGIWVETATNAVECGYSPNQQVGYVQYATGDQIIDVQVIQGQDEPTLEEVQQELEESDGTKTGTGGVPLILLGAVGILGVAMIVTQTGGKK